MKSILFFATLLLLSSIAYSRNTTFVINIDSNPISRFAEVYNDRKEAMLQAYNTFQPQLSENLLNLFYYLQPLLHIVHRDLYEEASAVSDFLGVDRVSVILMNFYAETLMNTNAVVAADVNGTLYHGFNIEATEHAELFRNLSFEAVFTKSGKQLFNATMFAGVSGVFSGYRGHEYSVSFGRRLEEQSQFNSVKFVLGTLLGFSSEGMLLRDTLLTSETFEQAYGALAYSSVLNHGYLAVVGKTAPQAIVLAREKMRPVHTQTLENFDNWYLLSTGEDHWEGKCNKECSAIREALRNLRQERLDKQSIEELFQFKRVITEPTVLTGALYPALNGSHFDFYGKTPHLLH